MSGRSYLSIGDVLTLLRQEFEDITISKIRFLESQGLVNPERTPSGYRKFYEHDVERLRWVLRQQREHFLPLKVIKDRLDDGSAEADGDTSVAPAAKASGRRARHDAAAPAGGADEVGDEDHAGDPVLVGQRIGAESTAGASTVSAHPAGEGAGLPGIGSPGEGARTPDRPGASSHRRAPDRTPLLELVNEGSTGGSRMATGDLRNGVGDGASVGAPTSVAAASGTAASGTAASGSEGLSPPSPVASSGPSSGRAAGEQSAPAPEAPPEPRTPEGGATPASASLPASPAAPPAAAPPATSSEASGVSLSAEELATASELDVTVVRELQEYGLLVPSMVAGVEYFNEEALAVATVAASFTRFGIEPRHLRLYKNAAEREAGFVEQVVLPLVRQRNPDARARAHETADELTRLGQQLRASLLRSALRNLLNG